VTRTGRDFSQCQQSAVDPSGRDRFSEIARFLVSRRHPSWQDRLARGANSPHETGNRIKYFKVDAESGDAVSLRRHHQGYEVDDLQTYRFRLCVCTIETASSSYVFALGVNLMDALRQSVEAGGKRTKPP
jgi:hypothetical protein